MSVSTDQPPAHADLAGELRRLLEDRGPRFTRAADLAYWVIRQAILSGVLAPGQALHQESLADSLGISRVPVRAALLQLEGDGLIRFRPHHGAEVSLLTPEQVRDIYETRAVLESYALRKAIETRTPERLARLESLAATLDAEEEGAGFADALLAFYRELYGTVTNRVMAELIEKLRQEVGRHWLSRRMAHGHDPVHAHLLEYVRSGDAEAAERWLNQHFREAGERLARSLEAADQPAPEAG